MRFEKGLRQKLTRRRFLEALATSGLATSFQRNLFGQGIASRGVRPAPRPKFSGRPWNVQFADIAARAGLTHPVIYGQNNAKRYIVEANGPGIAFYDYDHDGWLDIFLVNGTRLEGFPKGQEPTNHLYRNNRDGTFTDVTADAGLVRTGWGYGVCVGDYDNDGHDDLFLTAYGQNALYHNNGNGTFTDVTARAGLLSRATRFNTGCTFVDYDRDGYLDLFVSRYLQIDIAKTAGGPDRYCTFRGIPVNCGPRGLAQETCSLYHNNRDGTFADVTEKSGISKAGTRYGLTAAAFDYNNDGWPDLFVADDSSPNLLLRNNRDGTFTEVAMEAGAAVNGDGQEQANMGVAVGDYDGDGFLDIFATHFSDDTPILYHNVKGEFFDDVTTAAGLAVETRFVGWGSGFADFDNDGWLDLLEVNGTVYPEVEKTIPDYRFKMPREVFRNLGDGSFEEVSERSGAALLEPHSSRGCAFGDFDNDGKVEILVVNLGEPPSLLKNTAANSNHWLAVKLLGTKSNRSAIGARVTLDAGGRKQIREVMSGGSYISQSDLRQHFGLGAYQKVERLEIRWPNGLTEQIKNLDCDQFMTVQEGKGVVQAVKRP
ncbi:MAG: RNA-binding protein [Acidobacteria bacterium]|nr:MAG: RNA-binding protein [Acidobacteriota bacterium]